jgi:hypothetical protein
VSEYRNKTKENRIMVATMDQMNLLDYGFEELSNDELLAVDGGGILNTVIGIASIAVGTILIANAVVLGVAAGIGASVVGTPIIGVCAGIAAGAGVVVAGAAIIDFGYYMLNKK